MSPTEKYYSFAGDVVLASEGGGQLALEAPGGQSWEKQSSDGGGDAIVLSGDRAEHWKDDDVRTDLKYGAFSKEEDETIKAAVAEYIQVCAAVPSSLSIEDQRWRSAKEL